MRKVLSLYMCHRACASPMPQPVRSSRRDGPPVTGRPGVTSGHFVAQALHPRVQQFFRGLVQQATLLVEGILIYTVYRFKDADEAKPTKENRRLEITWTVATAIVLLFVDIAALAALGLWDLAAKQSASPSA